MDAVLAAHLVIFLFYICSATYDIKTITIGWSQYGGRFKFLTFINLVNMLIKFVNFYELSTTLHEHHRRWGRAVIFLNLKMIFC